MYGYQKTVEEIISDLSAVNSELESLLSEIPTEDQEIVSRLYDLIQKQERLLLEPYKFKESGTMFLEREIRVATFLKTIYNNARFGGQLHKPATSDA